MPHSTSRDGVKKKPRAILADGVADRAAIGYLGGWVYGVREGVTTFQYLDGSVYATTTFYIDKRHVRTMLRRERSQAKKQSPKASKPKKASVKRG